MMNLHCITNYLKLSLIQTLTLTSYTAMQNKNDKLNFGRDYGSLFHQNCLSSVYCRPTVEQKSIFMKPTGTHF